MERRRYPRFETSRTGSKLSAINRSGSDLELQECELLNISYGGMCFQTQRPFLQGEDYHFLIDLRAPLQDLVLVKIRIEWIQPAGSDRRKMGARFLESSKGWLGAVADFLQ